MDREPHQSWAQIIERTYWQKSQSRLDVGAKSHDK